MKRLVLLVRHFPTQDDAKQLLTPRGVHADLLPLDEEAVARVAACIGAVAELFAEGLTFISSTSQHAVRTASIVMSRCTDDAHCSKLKIDSRLENINQGSVAGITQDEFSSQPLYHQWHTNPATTSFPGGESLRDVDRRIASFAADYLSRPGATVVISHTTPMQVLLLHLIGADLKHLWNFYFAPYAVSAVVGDRILMNNGVADIRDWIWQLRE